MTASSIVPMALAFIVLVIFILLLINYFLSMPTDSKKQALQEWLKWAVTVVEKEYGGKTGQLKLRQVWDMALKQFPWLIKCFTFEEFSAYVDSALAWMRQQLAQNNAILTYVQK